MNSERAASMLLEARALRFREREPFVLASRKIGPVYIDVRQLTGHPRAWREVISELVQVVRTTDGEWPVSGGELADLFFSIPVALELQRPHLTIRKAVKGYGAGGRLVGKVSPGETFVHVSDLITSGKSAEEWVGVIEESGGRVARYVVVFDRNQGGREALRKHGVELESLVTLDHDFLTFAAEKGALSQQDQDSIAKYLLDPEGWSRDFLRQNPSFLSDRIEASGGKLTRAEGLEVLSLGYPALIPELGDVVRKRLLEVGVDPEVLDGAPPS